MHPSEFLWWQAQVQGGSWIPQYPWSHLLEIPNVQRYPKSFCAKLLIYQTCDITTLAVPDKIDPILFTRVFLRRFVILFWFILAVYVPLCIPYPRFDDERGWKKPYSGVRIGLVSRPGAWLQLPQPWPPPPRGSECSEMTGKSRGF